eukprot:maker-scaffold_29-snap-gene-1.6-mRNA-1 protein AED:0.00 eAED:0.00 QI:450/1/1/1/0/0/2/17/95
MWFKSKKSVEKLLIFKFMIFCYMGDQSFVNKISTRQETASLPRKHSLKVCKWYLRVLDSTLSTRYLYMAKDSSSILNSLSFKFGFSDILQPPEKN